MSRHRFVRNLDLDAELDDHDEEFYEGEDGEEPDDGMTPEERAQMVSALPVARAQLKGLKPPISDAEIQDSLWHYWFDVDKAVSWLKKDWEKKGDHGPPEHLVPTPEQAPRARRKTRKPKPVASEEKTQPVEATLTALQRLSLARKAAASASSAAPSGPASTPSSAQGSVHSSAVPSPTASPAPSDPSKPLSKLALLRQKRMESAKAPTSESTPASSSHASADLGSTSSPVTHSGSPSSEPSPSNPPPGMATPDSPAKPLSKLAQKMAAARAAREAAVPTSLPVTPHETPSSDPVPEPIDEMWAFTAPTPAPASVFFSILTTHTPESALPEPPSLADMHIAVRDREAAGRKVRDAFGPGVESPDDIVLRKRDGRAGTAAISGTSGATGEKAQAVRAVAAETPFPPSEVKEPPKTQDKELSKPKDKEPPAKSKSKDAARGGRPSRGRTQSPTKTSNSGNGRRASPEKAAEKAPSGSNPSSQPTGRPGGRPPPRPKASKSKQ